jgi:hypothetical protein
LGVSRRTEKEKLKVGTPERSLRKCFVSVVAVAFQIAFRAEIHANDIFLFFKNYF